MPVAVDNATRMILDLCGGEASEAAVVTNERADGFPTEEKIVSYRPERLLGLAANAAEDGKFLHDAGLAAEYLARVRRATGDLVGAGLAARSAREIYGRWGAGAKTELVSREFCLDG